MTHRRLFISALLALAMTAGPARAQWTATGLGTGFLRGIVGADTMFAGTSGDGVYRSANRGATWSAVNTGLANLAVNAVLHTGSAQFAATDGDGVFRSTNSGASWSATAALADPFTLALATSGSNLFAGSDGGGVSRSANGGAGWTAVNSGITNTRITSLAVSGTTLFAGTFGGGVFKSVNDGGAWSTANNGLLGTDVRSLVASGGVLIAGTATGVFRSVDDGANWANATGDLLNTSVRGVAVVGAALFACIEGDGVFLSTDAGAHWSDVSSGLTDLFVEVLAVSGPYLLAGTNGSGIQRRALAEMLPATDVPSEARAGALRLLPNAPNPIRTTTTIRFDIALGGRTRLGVFDALGREVATLVHRELPAGRHTVTWDATGVDAGVYWCLLERGARQATTRMIVTR